MKKLLSIFTSILFIPALAFAQPAGGGPGPGPTPSPWVINGSQIYYAQGCTTVSVTKPGGCHGIGSFSSDTFWLNGTQFTLPVSASNGGTGITSYAIGDLLYASGATALSKLTDVATGNALISGGVTTAPSWGKIGLTTHVSGTLPVGNGGSGAATFTANGVLYGNTTSAFGVTAAGTTGQYFKGITSGAPAWGTLASDAVTTISFGTTGLTPNSATAGAVSVAGTLVVANGGTGVATLTGIPKASGTSAFVAATAGSDYVAPGTATTFTAKQTFSGTSSNVAMALVNAAEPSTISATAATGTINYDVCTQSILYYTTNASANWTLNLRCSSGTSLNTAMTTGDTITVTFLVTQGGTPFYNNVLTVDGGANTPKCQGGTCPSAGNASGIDVYTYAIIKTGSAAFTVLESQTQFK